MLKAAIAAAALLATPAIAAPKYTYSSGVWTVFGGTSNLGTPMCGMEEFGPNELFAIKWFKGQDRLTIHLFSNKWIAKEGDLIPVTMQFSGHDPWDVIGRVHTIKGGVLLEYHVNNDAMDQFLKEVQDSAKVEIGFPGTNAHSWTVDLTGSRSAFGAFSACVAKTLKAAPEESPFSGAGVAVPLPSKPAMPSPFVGKPFVPTPSGRTDNGDIQL